VAVKYDGNDPKSLPDARSKSHLLNLCDVMCGHDGGAETVRNSEASQSFGLLEKLHLHLPFHRV
jgi:hypothetical protein